MCPKGVPPRDAAGLLMLLYGPEMAPITAQELILRYTRMITYHITACDEGTWLKYEGGSPYRLPSRGPLLGMLGGQMDLLTP